MTKTSMLNSKRRRPGQALMHTHVGTTSMSDIRNASQRRAKKKRGTGAKKSKSLREARLEQAVGAVDVDRRREEGSSWGHLGNPRCRKQSEKFC